MQINSHELWKTLRVEGCCCWYCVGAFMFSFRYKPGYYRETFPPVLSTDGEAGTIQPFCGCITEGITVLEPVPVTVGCQAGIKPSPVTPGPVICKTCNMKNDYGEPNQKDGSYVCYGCR